LAFNSESDLTSCEFQRLATTQKRYGLAPIDFKEGKIKLLFVKG